MKKIEFFLSQEYYNEANKILSPIPAYEIIPNWYREGERFVSSKNGTLNYLSEEDKSPAMKSCMPFLDSLTSGYFLRTWVDVEVTQNHNGFIKYKYIEKNKNGEYVDLKNYNHEMIMERVGDLGHTIPRPKGYAYNHMVWKAPWGWKLPRGWSMLVTHPFNQYQLPFITTTGIIDSDYFHLNGNIPFFFEKDFEGIIEKGTPIAQLIPIKRSSWGAINKMFTHKHMFLEKELRTVVNGYYRDNVWVKKIYRSLDDKNK